MSTFQIFRPCIVCPCDFIGGAELFVADFINEIFSKWKKYDFSLITSVNSPLSEQVHPDTEIIEMDFPRLKKLSPMALIDFYKTAVLLNKKIEQISPNVVMTNSIRAHLLGAMALKNSPSTPLAFFVHDFTFPKFFFNRVRNRADKIFTCSDAVKRDLINKGGRFDIQVIPNAVEYMPEKTRLTSRFSDVVRVGIIGRIDSWKGQDTFIDAAEYFEAKGTGFQFHIFGESSKHDAKTVKFEELLNKKVVQKKMYDKVKFRGFVPKDQALSEIDILVHTSTRPEPFGRVIIEAMAAGIPVIASNLGGTSEIIENGINGFLIEPGNPMLLAQKIMELVNKPKLRDRFVSEGIATVKNKFLLSDISRKLINELEKLK